MEAITKKILKIKYGTNLEERAKLELYILTFDTIPPSLIEGGIGFRLLLLSIAGGERDEEGNLANIKSSAKKATSSLSPRRENKKNHKEEVILMSSTTMAPQPTAPEAVEEAMWLAEHPCNRCAWGDCRVCPYGDNRTAP